MLLIAVDLEMLLSARSLVGHCLLGQVNLDFGLGVVLDALEEFSQKRLADHHRQHEVVQLIVFVNIGKERADDHAEAISRNGPCSMLPTGARAEVLARHEDAASVGGVVEHKVLHGLSVLVVAPVAEQVLAKALLVGSLQETGRNDLVCIYVL